MSERDGWNGGRVGDRRRVSTDAPLLRLCVSRGGVCAVLTGFGQFRYRVICCSGQGVVLKTIIYYHYILELDYICRYKQSCDKQRVIIIINRDVHLCQN